MEELQELANENDAFSVWMGVHSERIESSLEKELQPSSRVPMRLHEAMRYAVLNGGKRIRPLLVYAAGECLDVPIEKLDVPATSIELLHSFSLVHDDLPAMDNDELRRGQPTVHIQFDEATAILAADALQPLAFRTIAAAGSIDADEARKLTFLIAEACGSSGMTGGQAIDLASEGKDLSIDELTEMHALKTGALIRASLMSPCCLCTDLDAPTWEAMDRFSRDIGLAFQIRDDILDVNGNPELIGKPVGSDQVNNKATWPAIFGMRESKRRCDELLESALAEIAMFGDRAAQLSELATYVVERAR